MQALVAPHYYLDTFGKRKTLIQKLLRKFKRTDLCSNPETGGLKMIYVLDMQSSFLLYWAAHIQLPDIAKWKSIPQHAFAKLGHNLSCFQANVSANQFKGIDVIVILLETGIDLLVRKSEFIPHGGSYF